MIGGIIAAVLLIVLCVKYITKRMKNRNIDKVNLKIHKVIGMGLICLLIAHLIMVLPLIKQRPISIYIIGIIMIILAIGSLLSYCFRKRLGKKWIFVHRILAVVIMVCLAIHVGICMVSFKEYKDAVQDIVIKNMDASNVKDGVYEGEWDVGYIYAKVSVTVKDEKIETIQLLEHRNERGKKAEVIVNRIVDQQKVKVDAVSSATNSSKVIMKAVENALESGRK